MATGIGFAKDIVMPLVPATLGTLRAWCRGDSLSALADGAAVAAWSDESGNSRNWTQATSGNRPQYKTNVINGHSAVLFDGSNDFLQTASFTTAPQPITAFIVAQRTGSLSGTKYLFDGIASGNRILLASDTTTGTLEASAGSSIVSFDGAGTDFFVAQITYNGASSFLYINDLLVAAGNVGSGSLTGITLGATYVPNSYWQGYIAEVMFFDGALSADNSYAVRRYLQGKYRLDYFDPLTITGLSAWYSADRESGLLDGDAVSSFTDYSQNAIAAVQSTTANRPLYKKDVQNHKPVLRFDGSNDILAGASALPLGANDACTIYVVAKVTTKTNFGHFLSYGTNGSGSLNYRQVSTSGKGSLVNGLDGLGAGASSVATTPTGSGADLQGQGFKVFSAQVTAANQFTTWENGVQMDTTTKSFTLAASSTLRIGSRSDGFPLNGDIAEIIIASQAHSTAERNRIEGYLRAKYAI